MSYYEIQTDVLQHHGVLGQKWGVRRYQNPDGSLTTAGKKKYLKDMSKDMNEHFKKQIHNKEAAKVTKLGNNGHDVRGNAWNKAYRKGKVTAKDDAEIKKAAKETREYALNKYGKEAVDALSRSGVLGRSVSDFKPATINRGKSFVSNTDVSPLEWAKNHGAKTDGPMEIKLPGSVIQERPQKRKMPYGVIY